ncbi:hypothetical protein BTUL_0113g00090 [Botrytis tulipae]|uniref:Uncharacterized protein n=1 Tax=Botrytis tulipae TaxID=87230 RepID=A0A4Z1EJG4_9HELO|nr:hypothetical protein BTUL_0113g00090 [Botrytis tulipae]
MITATSAINLVNLPNDLVELIITEVLETVGLWKALGLRVVCRSFETLITRAICVDYMKNPHGPVDDALEICLNYSPSKLPRIAPLLIHMEMKHDPENAILAPAYQAICAVIALKSYTEEERLHLELTVCEAMEERLFWASSRGSSGRRELCLRGPRQPISPSDSVMTDHDNPTHIAAPEIILGIQDRLSVAIIANDIELTQVLLKDHNADAEFINKYFGRPLHLAARYGRISIIHILLEHGADLNAMQPYYGRYWQYWMDKRHWPATLEKEKYFCSSGSALRVSARSGCMDAVQILVQPRFNAVFPLPRDEIRQILLAAARTGSIDLISYLLEHFYNSHPLRGRIREEILLQASYSGREELVKLMLDRGVNVNCNAAYEYSVMPNWAPIHCAAYKGRSKIVSLLLSHGADRDGWCNRTSKPAYNVGFDAMSFAVLRGHQDVVRVLIRNGAAFQEKINVHASRESVPLLTLAAWSSHHHMMRFMLEEGRAIGESGEMALYYAVLHGDYLMTRLLLEAGTSPSGSVHGNNNPVRTAMQKGWAHILQLLLSAGAKEIEPSDSGSTFDQQTKTRRQLWHICGRY